MIQYVLVISGAAGITVYGPGADRMALGLIGSRLTAADPARLTVAVVEMDPIPIVPEPAETPVQAPVAEPAGAPEPAVSEDEPPVEPEAADDTEAQVQPGEATNLDTGEVTAPGEPLPVIPQPEEGSDELPAQ